ncbi:MAG TPA: efflux RND transporter periplasmic adaptor subunit, partial [Paracoccaceae bacterium]|nr:efflux RND transporter periplasmic adaptor subunit [Paracoccaceae bacterium]
MPIWKQILLILLLGAAGVGGYWIYDAKLRPAEAVGAEAETPRVTVETTIAEEQSLARVVEAVGTTRALRSVEIVPLASGRVTELLFRAGQQVGKGDVLVRLDDDIERADLTEAKALLVESRQAVERVQKLRKSNAVALAELERATAQFAAATATMERAERRLADREIRAPFAGVVGLSDVDFGAHVAVGTTITTLDDLSSVEIEFSLPEGLFAAIRIGQQIAASSVAYPKQSFAGEVIAIGTRVDPV